jgi:integrase
MASVHQRKGTKYWHGLISLPGGKLVFRSTGHTDKAMALQVATQWERAAKGGVTGSMEQARKVMAEILKLTSPEVESRPTVRNFVASWIRERAGEVAGGTLEFNASTLQAFVEWLGPRADLPMDMISREDILAFREAEGRRVSTVTANHRVKAVKQLFSAAARREILAADPAADVRSLRKERKKGRAKRPFTLEELWRLDAVLDEDWRLITWIGFYTGQRLGDVLRLRVEEFDARRGALELETAKRGLKVWIPIPGHLVKQLADWCSKNAAGGWMFEQQVKAMDARKKAQTANASKRFMHYLWRAGLREHSPFGGSSQRARAKRREESGAEDDRRVLHPLSYHSLRHTARTLLEEAGQPVKVIDAFIGQDGETGRIYTHVGEEALRKAAAVLEKAVEK